MKPWPQALLLGLAFLACIHGPGRAAAAVDPAKVYPARGVLRNYDATTVQATISHEAIAGYMPAMTMAYRVGSPREMAQIQPGDAVTFQLHVTANDAWIEQVTKIATSQEAFLVPAPQSPPRELSPGDPIPDLEMQNERGEKIRMSDFRGQVVAFTFVYSRCPLPTYCPLISNHLQEAQEILARIGVTGGWHFISITLDPEHDTPEVLAAVAQNRDADTSRWTFATAGTSSVTQFGRAFGLEFSRGANGVINHNLRTVVIDATGHLVHIFKGNTWTPQELAAEVRAAVLNRS